MRTYAISIIVFTALTISALSDTAARAGEIRTLYATLIYDNAECLQQFNDQVPESSSCSIGYRVALTQEEEAGCKLDVIVNRVEAVLDIFPRGLNFTLVLLPTSSAVQEVYKRKYGKNPDYIAFYSPGDNYIYMSANDVTVGVLAHELTHVIVGKYFSRALPSVIQEAVAQYVDSQIDR